MSGTRTALPGARPRRPCSHWLRSPAWRHFMPNGGQMTPAQRAGAMAGALAFSKCMRAHGLADFPDPVATNGGIGIRITQRKGQPSDLNPNLPQFQGAQKTCQGLLGIGKASAG